MVKDSAAPLRPGHVVRSTAGRDRGACYLIVRALDQRFVAVADGLSRTVRNPKRKNLRHLVWVADAPEPIRSRLEAGGAVGDEEIRQALWAVQSCVPAEGGSSLDGQG